MARVARVVVPGVPHHVTQRGNRRQALFHAKGDQQKYLSLLLTYGRKYGLEIWAYCLMPNHVHLVAVPGDVNALSRGLRDTHTTYASWINRRQELSGHLWQGRFFSCPLDERHLWRAVRYVERNPVRSGLVERAEAYEWSSAAAHCGMRHDPLVSGNLEQADHVGNWRRWLMDDDGEAAEALRQKSRTGRPCGSVEFVKRLEGLLGRRLRPAKRGRKPRAKRGQTTN